MTLRERLIASVTDIRTRGQRLIQLNLELLQAELKEKGKKFGAAIAMFVGAGFLALYAIGFALLTIAVALALVLPLWLSLLIVTLSLFLIVAILILVGREQLRKIGKPQPEAAIAEAKATADLLKANARKTTRSVRETAASSRARSGFGAPPAGSATPPPAGPDDQTSGRPSDTGTRGS